MSKKNESGFFSLTDLIVRQKKQRVYPTGNIGFNLSIGVFDPITGEPGIPEGIGIEMFGPNASLKTGMWESLAANMMKMDPDLRVCCILAEDPEPERLLSVGIDPERITIWTYYDPDADVDECVKTAERALGSACELVATDKNYKLVVVDSVKSLVSEKQIFDKDKKGELKEFDATEAPAIRAVLVNRFIGQWQVANKANAILFMTNQMTETIGPSYVTGSAIKTFTSGGRQKEHYCKLRVKCNSTVPDSTDSKGKHKMFGNDIITSYKCVYELQKNKFGFPFRRSICDFSLEEKRFKNETTCLDFAEYLGIIERSGNSIWNLDGKAIRGRKAAEAYLMENPEYMNSLWKQIYPRHREIYKDKPAKASKDSVLND